MFDISSSLREFQLKKFESCLNLAEFTTRLQASEKSTYFSSRSQAAHLDLSSRKIFKRPTFCKLYSSVARSIFQLFICCKINVGLVQLVLLPAAAFEELFLYLSAYERRVM